MLFRTKLLIGSLLLVLFGGFIRPIPAQAADGRCVRLTLTVDESNPSTPYYDYNPATETLTTLTQSGAINWYEESPDGRWVAMNVNGDEKGVEFIRFIDRVTERSIDYELEDAFNPYRIMGGQLTPSGWSPDGQFYAVRVINFANDTEERSLLIFGRDRSLMTRIPFDEQGGYASWLWLPDSRRIVTAQPDPSEIDSDEVHYIFQVTSVSGATVEVKLPETGEAAFFSSPDGNSLAVYVPDFLFVMNTRTGEVATISDNIYLEWPAIDLAWSANSQHLLYKVPSESGSSGPSRVNVMRYSVQAQDSAVVFEEAITPYTDPFFMPLHTPSPEEGALLVSQQSDETIQFHLIDARTGKTQVVLEEPLNTQSLNANSDWSPSGDVVWMSANAITFFRPERRTHATLPEGSTLVPMDKSFMGRWSQNGEWISMLVQNSDETRALAVVNTRIGQIRTIPLDTITDYERFYTITGNTGGVLIVQTARLSLISDDGKLTQLTDTLPWGDIHYGNSGAAWSPDGNRIATTERGQINGITFLKIFDSDGTLISSVELPMPMADNFISSLDWVPCL